MNEATQKAQRARGLARQVTEDRKRAEKTLEALREKERQLCLEALLAESAVPVFLPRSVS